MSDPTLRAWAYLSQVVEPPCAELAALVDRVGPVEAAERVRRAHVDHPLARHTEAGRGIDRAAEDLELLARRGGRPVSAARLSDPRWAAMSWMRPRSVAGYATGTQQYFSDLPATNRPNSLTRAFFERHRS
jgi:DNA processing protein